MSSADSFSALRQPVVRAVALGRMAGVLGAQIVNVAVGWHLYEITGSALSLGLVGLFELSPVVLLIVPAGNAADLYPRRTIAMLCYGLLVVAALCLMAGAFLQVPVAAIYGTLILTGTARAFSSPATGTILPQLLKPEQFLNANAWVTSSSQFAAISGPALGGLIIAWAGAPWAFFAAACCHFVAAVMYGSLPAVAPPPSQTKRSFSQMLAGFSFIRRTPIFLGAITLDMLAVLLGGVTALLPIFAKDILHVGPEGLGWLRAAPSLGALCMALTQTRLKPFVHPGRVLLVAVAGFGAAVVGFGLSENFILSLACLFCTGICDNLSVVIRQTLQQVITPDHLRGRVAAVSFMFISFSNELGAFESGSTAALFGTIPAVVGGGIGTLIVVLGVATVWPQLRRIGPLHTLRPAAPPS